MAERPTLKPSSVFATLIFALVFTMAYIFYPQISMLLPFGGQKHTTQLGVEAASAQTLSQAASVIVTATVGEKGGVICNGNAQSLLVYKNVEIHVQSVLKGNPGESLTVREYGGTALITFSAQRAQKYVVEYSDTAVLESGKNYLFFLDASGQIMNGACGVMEFEEDNYYRDYSDSLFSLDTITGYIGEVK